MGCAGCISSTASKQQAVRVRKVRPPTHVRNISFEMAELGMAGDIALKSSMFPQCGCTVLPSC